MAEEYDIFADTEDLVKPPPPPPKTPAASSPTPKPKTPAPKTPAPIVGADADDTGDADDAISQQIKKTADQKATAEAKETTKPSKTKKLTPTYAEKDPSYLRIAAAKYLGVDRPEETKGGFGGFTTTKAAQSDQSAIEKRRLEALESTDFTMGNVLKDLSPVHNVGRLASGVYGTAKSVVDKEGLASHGGSSLKTSTRSPEARKDARERLKDRKQLLKVGQYQTVMDRDGKEVRAVDEAGEPLRAVDPNTGLPTPTITEMETALSDMETAFRQGRTKLRGGDEVPSVLQLFGFLPSNREDAVLREYRRLSDQEKAKYGTEPVRSFSDIPRLFKADLIRKRALEYDAKQEDFDKIREAIQKKKNELAVINNALILTSE